MTSMRRDGHIDRSFKRLFGTKQLIEVCVKPKVYQMSVETRGGRNFGNDKESTHVASVNDLALSLAKNTGSEWGREGRRAFARSTGRSKCARTVEVW